MPSIDRAAFFHYYPQVAYSLPFFTLHSLLIHSRHSLAATPALRLLMLKPPAISIAESNSLVASVLPHSPAGVLLPPPLDL